jgi:hypothetical protein
MQKEQRVLFEQGQQRKFLGLAIASLGCISLRGLMQFDSSLNYSALKNYYSERRLLPRSIFENLCHIAKINPKNFHVKFFDSNWGQVKGGKKSRKFT